MEMKRGRIKRKPLILVRFASTIVYERYGTYKYL